VRQDPRALPHRSNNISNPVAESRANETLMTPSVLPKMKLPVDGNAHMIRPSDGMGYRWGSGRTAATFGGSLRSML
jgi:hypothetical protein